MEGDPPPLFDAHLHPEGLTDQDIESLRIFGVSAALVAAHHAAVSSTAREILARARFSPTSNRFSRFSFHGSSARGSAPMPPSASIRGAFQGEE